MSVALDGIKTLMRGCAGLPDDMSATELNHYAMEVLKRLKRGETAHGLEQYLRRLKAPGRAQPQSTAATRELSERVFKLVNKVE